MSRWDYDTVFYRVFCITLLAVAFTFTLILTNVFVDIDGLLSRKDKAKPPQAVETDNEISEVMSANIMLADDRRDSTQSEDVYDDKDYQDSTDLYRSKRSLAAPDILFHLKDRDVKAILTNRLTSLLDELDEDDNAGYIKKKNQDKNQPEKKEKLKTNNNKDTQNGNVKRTPSLEDDKYSQNNLVVLKDQNKAKDVMKNIKRMEEIKEEINNGKEPNMLMYKNDDNLLPLTNHNMVPQDGIGNRNFDDVYKKLAHVIKTYNNDHVKAVTRKENFNKKHVSKEIKQSSKYENQSEGEEIFDELMNFTESKKQIEVLEDTMTSMIGKPNTSEKKYQSQSKSVNPADPNLMIKTIIDITALTNDTNNKESDINSNDSVNGVVQLIYNGKSVNLYNKSNKSENLYKNPVVKLIKGENPDIKHVKKEKQEPDIKVPNSYYKKMIQDYMKRYSKNSESYEHDKFYSSKRLKRHIKIRYENNKTTEKPKNKTKSKPEDDELFVEIETHFDSKGTKGEKKKKLITDLIQKIQNAINSDIEVSKKKKRTHWHVKKRIQNRLDGKTATTFINKLMLPIESLRHRHLDPISKATSPQEDTPIIYNMFGHNDWPNKASGPRFLEKNINSAEMNTVFTDYSKILSHNDIPQRLQKPITTGMSDEILLHDSIDIGNVKFLMKDIDGSGFSIGFNQYTDVAPDPETMKLFTGLENVIQTYHQKYDQDDATSNQQQNPDDSYRNEFSDNVKDNQNFQPEGRPSEHFIERRSIKQFNNLDHHANKYILTYKDNPLPTRQKYYRRNEPGKRFMTKTKKINECYRTEQTKNVLFLNENVFEKKLKPAEILSIADLFQRKKRSYNVQKISNIKTRNKISRYLNTKTMALKKVFMNNKRGKREIDKIRIVARDVPASRDELPNEPRHSGEAVFVVSNENIFADRGLVREVEMPELGDDQMHFDIISPENHYEIVEPEKEQYEVISPETEHYDVIMPHNQYNSYDNILPDEKANEDHFNIGGYINDAPTFENDANEFTRRTRHNSLMSRYPHIIMEEISRSKEDMFPEDSITSSHIDRKFNAVAPEKSYKEEIEKEAVAPAVEEESLPNGQTIADLQSPPKVNNNFKVTLKLRPKNTTGMSGFKEVHTSINKSYNKNGLVFTSLVNVSQLSRIENVNKSISKSESSDHNPHIKKQQDAIRTLIRQHKHRIDEQLKQLRKEREKLEVMNMKHSDIAPQKLIDLQRDPKQVLHELNQLLFKEKETTTEISPPVTKSILTELTSVATTTTVNQQELGQHNKKITEKIERNEVITNEILKKLNQNTDVLKIFLGKLISKIDSNKDNHDISPINNIESDRTEDKNNESYLRNEIAQPKVVNNIPYNYEDNHQSLPRIYFRKYKIPVQMNHSSVPFVYAYQHPYKVPNKEINMENIIYNHHLHSDAIDNKNTFYRPEINAYYNPDVKNDLYITNKDLIQQDKTDIDKEFWQPKPGEKVINDFVRKNSSRFFIDELDDFKVLPLTEKKMYTPHGRPLNGTNA